MLEILSVFLPYKEFEHWAIFGLVFNWNLAGFHFETWQPCSLRLTKKKKKRELQFKYFVPKNKKKTIEGEIHRAVPADSYSTREVFSRVHISARV